MKAMGPWLLGLFGLVTLRPLANWPWCLLPPRPWCLRVTVCLAPWSWQGTAAGLHKTGIGGFKTGPGCARVGLGAAPAPFAFASLGRVPAGRGAMVASGMKCLSEAGLRGCFACSWWHIDQGLAWPVLAVRLAQTGWAWQGFAWGLGQAGQGVAQDMHGLAGPSCRPATNWCTKVRSKPWGRKAFFGVCSSSSGLRKPWLGPC